ncbi:ATP-binding cassette domain-containing protein [Acetobacterium paludosum]|uniref:ATP-binding cassette domain-containing protein n=1 Tax=Acetobacterium paludosum TaxID=52693 RepID=A0A923HVH1_9FIRM|nr:ABC transporter ATP-binding protein [Acetobacterium paludosum]MBC3889298.1 ATP-binding cassette domain-containing protein [Acetobacterium paludosum]
MIKLARYLKPYLVMLLIALALLFVQAISELNLPNFMSDIVNVGIQQNGIEHATPEAISQDGYALMTTFMTAANKSEVDKNYTLMTPNDTSKSNYDSTLKKYPLLQTESIYVLNQSDSQTYEVLDPIFGQSTWTFIYYMRSLSTNTADSTATESMSNVDFSQVYKALPMLTRLPSSTFDDARAQASQTPESIQLQTAIQFTNQFYTQLGIDLGSVQNLYILKIGGLMLLLSLLSISAAIAVGFFSARIAAGVAQTLRRDIFRKVQCFSNAEFDKFSTASLITRSTNDITQIQTILIMGIRILCYSPILAVGGIIMALRRTTSMGWIILVAVLTIVLIIGIVFTIAMPRFKIIQNLVDKLNLVTRENLTGLMVVRAFGNQKFEENRFDAVNKDSTRNNLFVNRIMVFMMPTMMFIMNIVSVMVVWVGAHQIAQSTMQVGDMMAFMQYAMQIIMSFLMMSMMFIMIPRAAVSGDRIQEVLAIEPSIIDPATPKKLPTNDRTTLAFDHVSFRYEGADEDVLHDISFIANPGETTAFIGSTGSGKSTLVNLIPRFFDVTSGAIRIDNIDVREVTQHDLREKIGYIPQKGTLFSGTVASNLLYGDNKATEEDLAIAARVAQATSFIESSEEGVEREIAQGGGNVSGGQKQRLSIARALVRKPDIYIFDDSFSALDYKTDVTLRRALKEYTGNSTVLIVAQRINTIMQAEQIIVLEHGRVVGKGTHTELLNSCETYREIASSQLTEEELTI